MTSDLWHRKIHRSWPKDAVLLNFHHRLHQRLHNIRGDIARELPTARILERSVFHISFDGVVELRKSVPDSGYLAWTLDELVIWFDVARQSGVFWEAGSGQSM